MGKPTLQRRGGRATLQISHHGEDALNTVKTPRIVAASVALASLVVASVSACSGAPEDGPASTPDADAPTDAAAPRDASTGSDAGRPDGAGADASMD